LDRAAAEGRVIPLASGLSYCDLHFLGVPRIIATAVVHGSSGVALIDPGPASTLPMLRRALESAGMRVADVRAILLTHIHLDHAGATGSLVKENPAIRVYVHEKGAPHMHAPEALIKSATRLWGDEMDRLWGEFLPVPVESMVTLAGGERIVIGDRRVDVLYTPGHAQHHVSFFNEDTGIAFVGDTAGIRRHEIGFVLPPTPPPDIDLETWRQSLARISEWLPGTLFITHFGPFAPPPPHLAEMADHLDWISDLAKRSLGRDETDDARERWFADEVRSELRRRLSDEEAVSYEVAGRFDLSWRGLARYWRKRGP
jgi:glyoxylase-like metal-dependent hydrolase (beta-lactamase superfamily II)